MSRSPHLAMEHVALNIPSAHRMAEWYCQNLDMKIVRSLGLFETTFLADNGGRVVLELYSNPELPMLDHPSLHPSTLHLAFVVDDVAEIRNHLSAAGATVVQDIFTTDAGDEMMMLKDPWGVTLQFIRRAHPMLMI
ncbi:VOC family protein [candidate division KSB1 bacterium]|nr:VOC family protein [candidate division KSB1 bacterium]